jgi:hypothetical protein
MTPTLLEDLNFTSTVVDGQDSYCKAFGRNDRPVVVRRCIIGNAQAGWGAKHSLVFDATYEDCTFIGGTKRAFDQVRGGNITFLRCKWENSSRPRVTSRWVLQRECDAGLKAGTRDVKFIQCSLNDVLLGDYSIYDQIARPPARRISFDSCTNPNGGPIFVRGRFVDGNSITAANTSVSTLVWPKFITSLYFSYNRKFGDKRVMSPDQFVIQPEESDT